MGDTRVRPSLEDENAEDGWGVIAGQHAGEYLNAAVDAFCQAALDYADWAGDEQGTGAGPADFGSHLWDSSRGYPYTEALEGTTDDGYSSGAARARHIAELVLGDDRGAAAVTRLGLAAREFGRRLWHSVNGSGGTSLDDTYELAKTIPGAEALGQALEELAGHRPFTVMYEADDPGDLGTGIRLYVHG